MNRVLVIIGVVVAAIGVVAGSLVVVTPQLFGLVSTESTPYAQYMLPLIIAGMVLVIVGVVMPERRAK
jgi:hypothetical protein